MTQLYLFFCAKMRQKHGKRQGVLLYLFSGAVSLVPFLLSLLPGEAGYTISVNVRLLSLKLRTSKLLASLLIEKPIRAK